MRTVRVIGIGAGDPEFLTVQAVEALKTVGTFFVLDKGAASSDLTVARAEVCDRFLGVGRYRMVTVTDPPRDRSAGDYPAAVEVWRDDRALALEQALAKELDEGGCGGILVWGDPSLYDGTIRVLDTINARGELPLSYDVIPGISSVQVLAARHRVTITRTAGAVGVTTGRRVAAGKHDEDADLVVMLDADLACARFRGQDAELYWGAYLGSPDEILVAGKLDDVLDQVVEVRAAARARKGWIMDTYLVRRSFG